MKLLTLTHNVSNKEVIINWDNVLYAAETETNFSEKYTEIAFKLDSGLPVKESVSEISLLLSSE
jgi:hypothetical protein